MIVVCSSYHKHFLAYQTFARIIQMCSFNRYHVVQTQIRALKVNWILNGTWAFLQKDEHKQTFGFENEL